MLLSFGLVIALELWEPEETLVHKALHNTKEPFLSVGANGDKIVIRPLIKTSDDRPSFVEKHELSALEKKWARIAWSYFENNYQSETGFVNSTDYYPSTTLWDMSSYLMGMISAHRLGIVEATENGIGWSALDIARFLVPLHLLSRNYPEFTYALQRVTQRWDLDSMFVDGQMMGARLAENQSEDEHAAETIDAQEFKVEIVQEGRLGYEEYAAKAALLEGWDASRAGQYDDNMKLVSIMGIDIATDSRDPKIYDAQNFVVTEPYVLDGIEFGWDAMSAELAWRIHEVQRIRYEKTGKLTAVSEDNIDQPPHFIYNSIFSDGKAWNTITEDGEDASQFATLSTKAAFGLHMLFGTEYTHKLISRLHTVHDVNRGWYSGIYEETDQTNAIITANTNGIILEALAFRQLGPLLKVHSARTVQVAQSEQ